MSVKTVYYFVCGRMPVFSSIMYACLSYCHGSFQCPGSGYHVRLIAERSCSLYSVCVCVCVGDLFQSLLPLIGEGSIQVANGSEGRRRHAMYSRLFTATAIRRYYDIYNKVKLSFVVAPLSCGHFTFSCFAMWAVFYVRRQPCSVV